jgi:uncharacterized membrane-anchored protein YhcB (DUF1043 family)
MRTSIARGLAISGICLLALPGCTNKRQQIKITKLESDLEALQQEFDTTVEEKEQEFSEKAEAFSKLEADTAAQIQQITAERDKLAAEYANFKKTADRAAAELQAKVPKDASTPGHDNFDPTKETKITNALTSVTGDVSTGSGFVVESEGKRYLYTTAGVLAGNSRLAIANAAGDKFTKFGNLEVADGCPFVRLELLEAAEAPALQPAASGAQVGSDTKLTVMGLNASSGAVTGDQTNAFGQSADAIDLDTNLLTGKIGGPIIETSTGKVLGIIVSPTTENTEPWADPAATGNTVPLRVSRLNRSLSWQPIPIATFLAEAKKITDFDRMTKIAQAFTVLTITPEGLGVDNTVGGSNTAKSILGEAKDFTPAVEVMTLHSQMVAKKARLGAADLKKKVISIFSSAMSQFTRNAVGFDPAKFSPYHRKQVETSLRWRKETEQRVVATSESISKADVAPPPDKPERDRGRDGRK